MPPKIAFLFLLDTDPHFSNIWDYYFESAGSRASIYTHPKHPEKVSWRPEAIIPNLQPTDWGYITLAYRALLAEAFADNNNIKFIFLSESCVPIKPFNELYIEMCARDTESWVKRMPIGKYDWNARLSAVPDLVEIVGHSNIIKHYSRTCLSRMHAKKVLLDLRVSIFDHIHAGDEFFLSGICPTRNLRDEAITEDDWDATAEEVSRIRKKIGAARAENLPKSVEMELWEKFDKVSAHPRTIHKLTRRDKVRILESRSFFYRKFARDSDIAKFIAEKNLLS